MYTTSTYSILLSTLLFHRGGQSYSAFPSQKLILILTSLFIDDYSTHTRTHAHTHTHTHTHAHTHTHMHMHTRTHTHTHTVITWPKGYGYYHAKPMGCGKMHFLYSRAEKFLDAHLKKVCMHGISILLQVIVTLSHKMLLHFS